ncbi:MAG: hypothetical protein R3F13_15095 [Prosthecobacter sp.]
MFIDTTGDGDLRLPGGLRVRSLAWPRTACQPMSLNALIIVKDVEALREDFVRFGQPKEGENSDQEKKKRIKEVLVSTGHFPSYASPTMWHVRDNLIFAMMNHEYGIKAWDAAEITGATVRARAEMNKMVAGLRGLGRPCGKAFKSSPLLSRSVCATGAASKAATRCFRMTSPKAQGMTMR